MSKPTFQRDMRDYYQRWLSDTTTAEQQHPYAENESWQRKFAALQSWIAAHKLEQGRVLEVGCGMGLLQDLVPDYVGVDIAASSRRHMRRPFSVSSATRLPFPDNSFDGVWSFWVLEHVNDPEQMLAEIRRVTRPGGSVFLCAGYGVDPWVSQGLHKRPYRDLTLRQRLTKLTIPLRGSKPYKVATNLAKRLADLARYSATRQPTRLRYGTLQPNFETYWDYDADACNALDSYNVALYFLSRGDRPQLPAGPIRSLLQRSEPQAYQVRK